jgi:purine-nucleoside phosphorylase
MRENDAIINPVKSRNTPDIGPVAIMVATRPDLLALCEQFHFDKHEYQRLMSSRLYFNQECPDSFAVVGPFIGAPYAVMLLETVIAWGVRNIIFLGWCGAIAEEVKIGDIVLATSAVIDEGTSIHYGQKTAGVTDASTILVSMLRQVLKKNQIDFHAGKIWTTDAVYRETRRQVAAHQQGGILAVEMELSALFSVAQFRQAALAGILVVSDELSSFSWRPGFKDERFAEGRRTAYRVLKELCRTPELLNT